MANGDKPQGDPWIWLFLVVLFAMLISARGGSFFGGSEIRFGSPGDGTVEEELQGVPPPAPLPPPSPLPTPVPPGSSEIGGNQITLQAFGSARLGPTEEYVELRASSFNKSRVLISGLILKNRKNDSAQIGRDEFGNLIFLNPGESAVIATSQSPRGFNFKVNRCSGYLAQAKTYSPPLPSFCPRVSELNLPDDLSDNCISFLKRIPNCTTPNINFQTGIDDKCSRFVGEHANYTGCVSDFKNLPDFDQKEWRAWLGRTQELWSNTRETIRLFSPSGALLAEISYQ